MSKRNYYITIAILWKRFIFSDKNYKDCSLNLLFPFLKYIQYVVFGIEVDYSFWDHANLIYSDVNFQDMCSHL
jgi:hypothetical protein